MKGLLAALVMMISTQVFAQNVLSGGFYLSPGQMQSIPTGQRYIEQVFVQAAGAGYRDGTIEVWANGRPKGTIYVPGSDPNYIVTIRESVRSLEFRHVSGGAVQVYQVTSSGSGAPGGGPQLGGMGYSSDGAVNIAQRAIQAVNELKPQSNLNQLSAFIMPIRKSAARLYAIGANRSPYSLNVRNALIDLRTKINQAANYLDANLETDSAFDVTVELMSIKEAIDAML